MAVELYERGFDPWAELQVYQQTRLEPGHFGATASFVGTMRDFNEGAAVERLFLEHYPGMTERELERIVAAEVEGHGLLDALVVHRVGAIEPGEPIVLVATWSAHRAAAFDACRAIMEALKSRAPFWKNEATGAGARWVERNTPG
ncbi:MAG: molybdenum cofactor biosynthesis protein MoaE [Halofilum sp. (in: g-proteobacteria)]|nr:molybdenum cofactor biosynthesis protein MoaE [Halofilum sp. (in: g-proteobacteria)]